MANVLPQLDFMQAVKLALSRLKETNGRSRRSEFWWAILALYVGGGIVGYILKLIPYLGFWLYLIVSVAVLIVSLPLFMRRMHDVGKGDGLLLVGRYIVYSHVIARVGRHQAVHVAVEDHRLP